MDPDDTDEKRSVGDIKICAVCGDLALGYNFNAITCESCKAFFRRNALKNKVLKCPFKDSCGITAVTRKFCQRCRLAKCYSVGMKSDLIMSEAEKESKRRKILANRAKLVKKVDTKYIPAQEMQPHNDKYAQTEITTVDRSIQTDYSSHCSYYKTITNHHSPTPARSPLDKDQIGCHTVARDLGPVPLNPTLQNLLDDLTAASRALEAPLDQEISTLPSDEFKKYTSKSLIDVINLTALAIRRLIKMCKRMSGFKALCQEDQLALLKQSCTQMMLLRSVITFDADKNSWKIPHTEERISQIQVEILKEVRGNIYEAHETFLRTFDVRASHDMNVMCILTAIALFDPNKAQLVDRHLIVRYQEMYYNLLQRYLESVYRYQEALEIYHHLIMKIIELKQLNEDHVRVYLEVNPSQVEPILIEIFDLKPH